MSYKAIIMNPDDVLVGCVDDNSIRPIEYSYDVCGLKFKSQEELMDICRRAAAWDRLVKLVVDEGFANSVATRMRQQVFNWNKILWRDEMHAVIQVAIQRAESGDV